MISEGKGFREGRSCFTTQTKRQKVSREQNSILRNSLQREFSKENSCFSKLFSEQQNVEIKKNIGNMINTRKCSAFLTGFGRWIKVGNFGLFSNKIL